MRFYNYLKEQQIKISNAHTADGIAQIIFRDCKKYCSEIGIKSPEDLVAKSKAGTRLAFYRGVSQKISQYEKFDTRKRTPQGTYIKYFPIINT
jgi:hypothetical protein